MLRGNGEGNAWPLSVREAADKIEQQAQTLKGKWGERKRQGAGAARRPRAGRRPSRPRRRAIVRATRYAVKPMSVEDAALRVEARPRRSSSSATPRRDAVSILYRRKDGNLGLIEPD